jgi:hypothetical protein
MRIFFLWYYYPWYLRSYYQRNPGVASLPFDEQRRRLFDDHFWWPADLAAHMAARGFATEFVIANARQLQNRWCDENAFRAEDKDWERRIALEQIRRFKPDVVWMASHFDYFGPFVREIRRLTGRVVVWVGEPWPCPPDLDGISVLITENPDTFKPMHHKFERVVVTKPGFSPAILDRLGPVAKQYDITCIGQFTRVHHRRTELVAHLLRNGIPVRVFGLADEDSLPNRRTGLRQAAWWLVRRRDGPRAWSVLRRALRPSPHQRNLDVVGQVLEEPRYGMDMFRILAASRLTLNVHGDIAGRLCGNMRMFEATGVGACLLTEEADNLTALFEPGREVLTYRDGDDLLATVRRALGGDIDVAGIGAAGQRRTLREHTMDRVLRDVAPALRG